MTTKTTTEQPVELTENATNEVQGGILRFTDLLVSSVKDGPKKSKESSFTADSFSFGVERE